MPAGFAPASTVQPETAFYGGPLVRRDNQTLAETVEQAAAFLRAMNLTGTTAQDGAGAGATSAAPAAPRPAAVAAVAALALALHLLLC